MSRDNVLDELTDPKTRSNHLVNNCTLIHFWSSTRQKVTHTIPPCMSTGGLNDIITAKQLNLQNLSRNSIRQAVGSQFSGS